jgi:hypothetical protein
MEGQSPPPVFLRWLSAVPFTVEEWTGIGLFSEDYAFRVFGGLLGMNAFTVWSLLLEARPHAAWFFGVFFLVWVMAYIWMQRGLRSYRPRVVFALQSTTKRRVRHLVVASYMALSALLFVGSLVAVIR